MTPNTDTPKKPWVKPEIEILSKDVIQTGSTFGTEGVFTPGHVLLGSGS